MPSTNINTPSQFPLQSINSNYPLPLALFSPSKILKIFNIIAKFVGLLDGSVRRNQKIRYRLDLLSKARSFEGAFGKRRMHTLKDAD